MRKSLYQWSLTTDQEYLGPHVSGSTVTVEVKATFWKDGKDNAAKEFEQKVIDMLTAYEK